MNHPHIEDIPDDPDNIPDDPDNNPDKNPKIIIHIDAEITHRAQFEPRYKLMQSNIKKIDGLNE